MPLTDTTTRPALTTAERRALRQIKTSGDRFAVIAADHGQPLVDMLDALGVSSAPEEQRAFKADLVDTVGRDASAVLLDPDVSLPDIVDRDLLARDVGLLVRIEADGHQLEDGLRRSELIEGLGAEGARARGATAAKVMVFLRADREDLDGYTAGMVRAALEDCRRADLLCVMELMTYRLDDETPEEFAARKEDLVVDGAVFLQECGSKVLKLEYPGQPGRVPARDRRDRRAVGRALGRRRPRGVLRAAPRLDGRRRGRLHRRALAVEGGRRPARRRAAAVPRRRGPPPHGGPPRRSSTQRASSAAAPRRHRRRHDVLQGARARRRGRGAGRGPRTDAVDAGSDRRRAGSPCDHEHRVRRGFAGARRFPAGRRGSGRGRRHGRDRRAARSAR